MNNRILSIQDCTEILQLLVKFSSEINEFYTNFDQAITTFNTDATVQSFYASGTFGMDTQNRLMELRNAVKQIIATINTDANSLIPQTKQIMSEQMKMLSSRGSSIESSY